ncbi:MAG: hypothetical protein ABI665_21570, partial [Vicinamibacterales bacterium]
AGTSMYDRILVMATSSAPAAASGAARPTPSGPGPNIGTQRFVPPRAVIQPPEDDEPEDEPETPQNQPVFTFPQPGQQPGGFGPQGVVMPPPNMNPNGNGPSTITINPPPPPAATPNNGFGVTGAPTPGMIQQPAQPGQPGQPGPMVRPPGK